MHLMYYVDSKNIIFPQDVFILHSIDTIYFIKCKSIFYVYDELSEINQNV